MKHSLKKLLLMSFGLIAAASVQASDFLFQVPVKLDRVPKGIPQAKVQCEVFTYRDNQNPIATGYTIKPIDLRSGDLYQEVDVSVNFHSMSRHLKPHQYRCQLWLLTPWAKPTWQQPDVSSNIPALQPRENSKLVTTVSGLIN